MTSRTLESIRRPARRGQRRGVRWAGLGAWMWMGMGAVVVSGGAAGCAPRVQLVTPEPVRLDVTVKVDVFAKDAIRDLASGITEDAGVGHSRRNRWREVQTLKDNGLVGETRDGYLVRRGPLPEAWTAHESYVNELIRRENYDRQLIYAQTQRAEGRPLDAIETEAADRLRKAAHAGEWVQVPDGTWQVKGSAGL